MRFLLPVLAALVCVLAVAVSGLTEKTFFGTPLEDHLYGYFFRTYPLFFFAAAYGAARIVAAALTEAGGPKPWRVLTTPLALFLFLAACVYPTFGGIILRPGFMTGGMSFVRGQSAGAALVLGAGAAAFSFGLLLGLCVLLARLSVRFAWRKAGRVVVRFLALWSGAVVLLAPSRLGIDPVGAWPAGPLTVLSALKTACVVALALLPHALVVARNRRG